MTTKRVAVIGATGVAGQQFLASLAGHPFFEVVALAASERSAGKPYRTPSPTSSGACRWYCQEPLDPAFARIVVEDAARLDATRVDLVFTAVESDAARDLEPRYAKTTPVVSTASAFRYEARRAHLHSRGQPRPRRADRRPEEEAGLERLRHAGAQLHDHRARDDAQAAPRRLRHRPRGHDVADRRRAHPPPRADPQPGRHGPGVRRARAGRPRDADPGARAGHGPQGRRSRRARGLRGCPRPGRRLGARRAEAYPDLTASANFLSLQDELTNTEDRIAAARRFYNGNVRAYNTRVATFPSNVVASMFSFRPRDFFELTDPAARTAPTVDL